MFQNKYTVTLYFTNSEGEEGSIKWVTHGSALDVIVSIGQLLEEDDHIINHPSKLGPPISNQIVIERLVD